MGIVITIIVVVVVVAIVAGVVIARRKGSGTTPAEPAPPPREPRPEPPPMTGLEDALNKATDRTGHSMAERLDAETDHVDQLRQTDDTGPLLRRALDSVDRPNDPPPTDDPADPADPATPDPDPA